MIEAQGLTLVGLSLTGLEDDAPFQLVLPFETQHDIALDLALDRVRDRFGSASVTRAVLLDRWSEFVTMPAGRDYAGRRLAT